MAISYDGRGRDRYTYARYLAFTAEIPTTIKAALTERPSTSRQYNSFEEENYCSKSQGSTSIHCGATNSRFLHQVIQICWRSGRSRSHFKKNMANALETVPLPLIVFFAAAIGLCQAWANFLRSSGLRPSSCFNATVCRRDGWLSGKFKLPP